MVRRRGVHRAAWNGAGRGRPAGFFVDETDLALGKVLAARHDVVYPGHPGLPEVPRGTLDDAWLPVIGAKRLVVTRDRRIRYRPVTPAAAWR